jgi:hypothetical protein
MLKFHAPAGGNYTTEEDFWELVGEVWPGNNPTASRNKEFIDALKQTHRRLQQVIHYTFAGSSFNKAGVDITKILLLDPAYPNRKPIGVVEYDSYRQQFAVHTRECTNVRGVTLKGMGADRSKDIKKAVRLAVKKATPYDTSEIARITYDEVQNEMFKWVAEARVPNTLLRDPVILEEIANLVEQGVVFKTEEFKQAAENIPMALERNRRTKTMSDKFVYVIESTHGSLSVGRYPATDVNFRFSSIDDLPEFIREKFSLLRLLPAGTPLPEVGYRTADGVSWLVGITPEQWAEVTALKHD